LSLQHLLVKVLFFAAEAMVMQLYTARLIIDEVSAADAAAVLDLLNEPDFIRNIADRGVRTLEQAVAYIEQGPRASYQAHGHGLWRVRLKEGPMIGLCGLIYRDYLGVPDVGYGFMARYFGQGYATEAAQAVLDYGFAELGMQRICGIVSPHNDASKRILQKIGLHYVKQVQTPEGKILDYFEVSRS
jgi:RimJ/RimL family protein N-acetyltransferase